jgi:hypothetical protein
MVRISNKLVTGFVLLLSMAAAAQSVSQSKDGKVTGPGFVVTLPASIVAEPAATPECEHGFYIELPPRPADSAARAHPPLSYRYIALDTRWDAGDLPSLDDAVATITSNLLASVPAELVSPGDLTLEANLPARLGTIPARRLVIRYRNARHQPAIRQVIVAYHARKDAAAIVYILVLNTTEENFQEDVEVLGKVMASFKVTEP